MRRVRPLSVTMLAFGMVLALSCGGGGGGGGAQLQELGQVTAYYGNNGVNWNDYVKNDGATIFDALDTDAAGTETGGYTANIHGGEMRAVAVTGLSACDGVTASDALGAFEWVCLDGGGQVTVVSTGLAEGAGLSDLLDFEVAGWLDNRVTVFLDGEGYGATPPAAWWDNPVMADNDGGTLGSDGTIYVVNAGASLSSNWVVGADRVGLVIEPGFTMEGAGEPGGNIVSASNRSFLWFEGGVQAHASTQEDMGFRLAEVIFTRLNNVTVSGNGKSGIWMAFQSDNNIVTGVNSSGNTWHGIELYLSSNNIIRNFTASGNSGHGVIVNTDSNNNILTGITATGSGHSGVYLNSSSNNTLTEIAASGDLQYGVLVSWSSNNSLSGIIGNGITGYDGIHLYSSSNNTLTRITGNGNRWYGVKLYSSSNNTFTDVTATWNSGDGIILTNGSSSNIFVGVTAANNDISGIRLEGSSGNTVAGVVTVNNGADGLDLYYAAGPSQVIDAVLAHNSFAGVSFSSSYEPAFAGLMKAGANSWDAWDGSGAIGVTTLNSQAETGISLAGSFAGWVTTDDEANLSDADGFAMYDSITDWTTFENPYRVWGRDGPVLSGIHRGMPHSNNPCRIWDWSLDGDDTVLLDALGAPGPSDTLSHTWSPSGSTVFLRSAVEIRGDGAGNDDGLCEAGEDCVYIPDVGSYHGHGELLGYGNVPMAAGTVGLYVYGSNGY